ncbi:hypothetical protein Gasu2_21200 [Galdieria sulphuraria]|nr:hypothetical protein Gasu2_21200 [Galdieria sulphuraria]
MGENLNRNVSNQVESVSEKDSSSMVESENVGVATEKFQHLGSDFLSVQGWWTERWGCSLDKTYRFGDKYGVDDDGSAWAEWWLERDLDIKEGEATLFVKKGRRWGYNQKNESWMETWRMTANGTYYTEFQMLPPSQFLDL